MGLGNYYIRDSDNFWRIVFFWELKAYNLDMFTHSSTIQSLLHNFDHQFDVSFIQPNGCELYSFPTPQKLINKISASPLGIYNCVFDYLRQ